MVRYEANPFPAGKSWGIGQGPLWPRGYCPSDSTSQSSYFYVKIACFFTRPDDIDVWVRVICRKLFYLKKHMSPVSICSLCVVGACALGPGRNVLLYLSARRSSINRQRSPLHNTKTYVYIFYICLPYDCMINYGTRLVHSCAHLYDMCTNEYCRII